MPEAHEYTPTSKPSLRSRSTSTTAPRPSRTTAARREAATRALASAQEPCSLLIRSGTTEPPTLEGENARRTQNKQRVDDGPMFAHRYHTDANLTVWRGWTRQPRALFGMPPHAVRSVAEAAIGMPSRHRSESEWNGVVEGLARFIARRVRTGVRWQAWCITGRMPIGARPMNRAASQEKRSELCFGLCGTRGSGLCTARGAPRSASAAAWSVTVVRKGRCPGVDTKHN